jgi:NH3-dependent NAD+ synthetase
MSETWTDERTNVVVVGVSGGVVVVLITTMTTTTIETDKKKNVMMYTPQNSQHKGKESLGRVHPDSVDARRGALPAF